MPEYHSVSGQIVNAAIQLVEVTPLAVIHIEQEAVAADGHQWVTIGADGNIRLNPKPETP